MQQYSSLILPAVIIIAFYLLLIRPQQQQAKKQREMIDNLEPGAEIVTIGGIYATVVSVDGERIRVSVADGSELEIAPRAVNMIVTSWDVGEHDEDADEDADEEPLMADGSDSDDAADPDPSHLPKGPAE
jgi:preprotein translocase subunit YajC